MSDSHVSFNGRLSFLINFNVQYISVKSVLTSSQSQGLQRSGLLDILMLAEAECEANYRDMIQEYKNAYLQR